jgi:hypothetical protein
MTATDSQNCCFFHNTYETPTFEEVPGNPEGLFKGGDPDLIDDPDNNSEIISISPEFGSSNHSSNSTGDSKSIQRSTTMSLLRDVTLPTDP